MLAVVLAILVKVCHFRTRIKEHIKNDNKSHIFKHLHSTTACFDSHNYLCFKIIDKANSKFDLKMKEALHKPNFKCTTKSLSSHPFNIGSVPLVLFCFNSFFIFLLFLCVSLSSIIFIASDANHRHLLLSQLHFTITLSHYNTSCMTSLLSLC